MREQGISQDVVLFLHVCLQPGLIARAHQKVLEWTPDRVVLPLSQVLLGLVSEHPVL